MASTKDFVDFVCGAVEDFGDIRSKKMFGEYMVYINNKPILLICDNVVYIKMKDKIKEVMKNANTDYPYHGSKLHYILDIEEYNLVREVIPILERITDLPKPKKKKQ